MSSQRTPAENAAQAASSPSSLLSRPAQAVQAPSGNRDLQPQPQDHGSTEKNPTRQAVDSANGGSDSGSRLAVADGDATNAQTPIANPSDGLRGGTDSVPVPPLLQKDKSSATPTPIATPRSGEPPSTRSDNTDLPSKRPSRTSTASLRQNGPSLLTQQLASARGASHSQPATQSSPPRPSQRIDDQRRSPQINASSSHSPSLGRDNKALPRLATSETRDGSSQSHSFGTLTSAELQCSPVAFDFDKPQPPGGAMSSSAALVMPSHAPSGHDAAAPPSSLNPSILASAREMLSDHRSFLERTTARTSSSLELDRHMPHMPDLRDLSQSTDLEEQSTPTKESYLSSEHPPLPPSARGTEAPSVPFRPKGPEHRFTLGQEKTEKIWSIGSGEGDEEDGLVEKSVTEAMAGMEHNARSRKASYSLRFFKEGLPAEDKTRRRDTKGPPRGKLSPAWEEGDTKSRSRKDTQDSEVTVDTTRRDESSLAGRVAKARSAPQSPTLSSRSLQQADTDYFNIEPGKTQDEATPLSSQRGPLSGAPTATQPRSPPTVGPEPTPEAGEEEGQRASADGESHDDGDADESGEEKISSAVFLPHQEIGESPVSEDDRSDAGRGARQRSSSLGKRHPWLVKADEPESEGDVRGQPDAVPIEVNHAHGTKPREPQRTRTGDSIAPAIDSSATQGEFEVKSFIKSKVPPSATTYDDHVHEHQHDPQEPLEAIELIPYKHQVGGHTTLWRFSRRAVCKQLNSRENEFYETIERYHRDLLAFLPRYIGVLNVTFQRQPRRKSIAKKDEAAAAERKRIAAQVSNGDAGDRDSVAQGINGKEAAPVTVPPRVVSQSMATNSFQIPTVTFDDNWHILPRNLLQPTPVPEPPRRKSMSSPKAEHPAKPQTLRRPPMDDRPNSWGATTVNKRLRNEVFNDAFMKEPVEVQRHRRPHQRSIPRPTLQRLLRTTVSDPDLARDIPTAADEGEHSREDTFQRHSSNVETQMPLNLRPTVAQDGRADQRHPTDTKDVTGTSAPEADTLSENLMDSKKKRRYSSGGLRRKPSTVEQDRGDLKYFEEADDAGYGGDSEGAFRIHARRASQKEGSNGHQSKLSLGSLNFTQSTDASTVASELPSPLLDFKKIPRPVNPKEAKTQQRDRVEYFLLLEDLTAGMKRPCMMDLKMGTRQYGPEASPEKQRSQQEKCRTTTSAELGVRICGLQVWDARTQTYEFQDKYFGRRLKAGQEFQNALQRFLYDGVDLQSILRHIPVVLKKLARLEQIVRGLRGYRFYAASLLMFYDGATSETAEDYDTAYDSMTDAATDTEEVSRNRKRNPREIDFKIADFANSLTPLDRIQPKQCPPQHPDSPDLGFLKGLRSLRRYFLQIQCDVRSELNVGLRNKPSGQFDGIDEDGEELDEGNISL